MERLFSETDGMDEDGCLYIYDGSYDFYANVLDTFVKEIEKTLAGMKETFSAGDVENYRIFVHGLKGSGGSVGAKELVRLATDSNDLIKNGDFESAKQYHQPILEELDRLSHMIPERLKEREERQ